MGQLVSGGWTLEQSNALKGFVESGMSYAESADAINKQFNTNYSRNAAIGRANRIGLACPPRPAGAPKERKPREHKARVRFVSANGNSNAMRVIRSVETEPLDLRCVEIVPRNVSLMDLGPNDCRYPYNDGPFTFCGHPNIEGSSYCGPHQALSQKHPNNVSEEGRLKLRLSWLRRNGLSDKVYA